MRKWTLLLTIMIVVLITAGGSWLLFKEKKNGSVKTAKPFEQKKAQVESTDNLENQYDLIVVGTDPEGVSAAVSAARNGQKTLLIDGKEREVLGGLMTIGWLNSLDMNYARGGKAAAGKKPEVLNKGIFSEWFSKIEGDSFDITTAADAFYDLVKKEDNIDLYMKAKSISPVLEEGKNGNKRVSGVKIINKNGKEQTIQANAVIDATQDGDIMAEAGVPFTYGLEDVGNKEAKMVVTLVFRLKNATPDVWEQIKKRLNHDDDPNTGANEVSAWGYHKMNEYPAVNKDRVKMRGLNIGRQNNQTILINALQIFDVDGLNPKEKEEAFQIAKEEIPHVLKYMKENFPEFTNLELDGTAPELYVRETRHMQGEYRLTSTDVLENKDQWDRIAIGSYPVDIQRLRPDDPVIIVYRPQQYSIPFRSLIPKQVDGLLVVGRSASYDSVPHGSARVIPTGMAEGEAAGVAVRLANEKGMTFREMSASKETVAQMQDMLNKQGMELYPFQIEPADFMKHRQYEGLKTAVSLMLATRGYSNEFQLDEKSNDKRMADLVNGAKKMKREAFSGDAGSAIQKMEEPEKTPLTLAQATYTITQALGLPSSKGEAQSELEERGMLTKETLATIKDKKNLTYGDSYMLIKDLKNGLK